METTLTIKLDKSTLEKAKKYASIHNKELSEIIESFLKSLTSIEKDKEEITISPFVQSMKTGVQLPKEFDYKKEYIDYLLKKYQAE